MTDHIQIRQVDDGCFDVYEVVEVRVARFYNRGDADLFAAAKLGATAPEPEPAPEPAPTAEPAPDAAPDHEAEPEVTRAAAPLSEPEPGPQDDKRKLYGWDKPDDIFPQPQQIRFATREAAGDGPRKTMTEGEKARIVSQMTAGRKMTDLAEEMGLHFPTVRAFWANHKRQVGGDG